MSDQQNCQFKWPLIGHAKIINFLQKNLNAGRIAQAYLFVGPENIGKSSVAEYLMGSLVCRHLKEKNEVVPCNKCECCRQLINKIHPDIHWISLETSDSGKLKKNISIEQIRNLQEKLNFHSFLDGYKAGVIDQAHTLSQEAANSLLKTLEEPAPNTVIILLTQNLAALPSTIASRCQVINFLPVPTKDIIDGLIGLGCEKKKAIRFSAISFGRPGLAVKYFLEPDFYEEYKEKVANVFDIFAGDINLRLKMAGKIAETGDVGAIKEEISLWKNILRDAAISIFIENQIANQPFLREVRELGKKLGQKKIIALIKEIDQTKYFLDSNANSRLALENLVLNF